MLYGPSHERAKETEANGTVSYNFNPRLDSGLHADYRVKANGDKAYVNYLYAGNRPVGTYTINWAAASNTTSYDLKYFHLDGQGSIIAITNSVGAVVERLSYDAWGKRRNANGTDDLSNALVSSSTDHGYTGHEHLDDMGLIHMNGRVYDPRTGRFLQADPTIQSPGNLQSFNRYSYVMNNPFFGTDPSGYDITFPGPTVTYTDGYGNPGTTTGPSVNIPCTCGLPPNMNLPGIANPNIPIITPLLSNVSNFLNNTTSQFMVGYNGKKSVTDDPLTNIGEIGQKTKDTLTFLNDVIVAAPVVGGVYTAVDAGLKADVGGLLFGLATIGVDLYTLDGRRSA